jgi:hypothetical protein
MMASNRKEYIEAAKAAFLNIAKREAMKNLALKFGGWIVAGPMGIITAYVVAEVLEAGIEKGETGVFFIYVDFRVRGQEKDFVEASIAYYRIRSTGSQEEKNAAEERLITAFDDFVKLTSY